MTKKEIATAFLEMASSGKVDEAYERYIHPDFTHHNAYFKGDRATFLKEMKESAEKFPHKVYKTLRALEDGNLVVIHGKVTGVLDKDWSVIHIFRFAGDQIIESWEASQEALKDSPNENGIF